MKSKKTFVLLTALCIALVLSAQQRQQNVENVFTKTLINFDPSTNPDGLNNKDSIIFIGNGRIALKKVKLPNFTNNTELTAFSIYCSELKTGITTVIKGSDTAISI